MAESILYSVVDWNKNFETHRTRELKRMDWVAVPNKMDGDGFTELMDHPEGVAHYGIWMLIICIASKCEPRGILQRAAGKPHDVASMSRISRADPALFRAGLNRLVEIGWIGAKSIACNDTAQSRANPAQSRADIAENRATVHGMEGNGREWKDTTVRAPEIHDLTISPGTIAALSSPISAAGFEAFWIRWGDLTQRRVNKSDSLRAWIGMVTPGEEPSVMGCLERYGSSADVARGAILNPEKWIYAQARDKWETEWPAHKSAIEMRSEALLKSAGDD